MYIYIYITGDQGSIGFEIGVVIGFLVGLYSANMGMTWDISFGRMNIANWKLTI